MKKITSWQEAFDVLYERLSQELSNVPCDSPEIQLLVENLLSAFESVCKDIER